MARSITRSSRVRAMTAEGFEGCPAEWFEDTSDGTGRSEHAVSYLSVGVTPDKRAEGER